MSCEHNFLGSSSCEYCGADEHGYLVEKLEQASGLLRELGLSCAYVNACPFCGGDYPEFNVPTIDLRRETAAYAAAHRADCRLMAVLRTTSTKPEGGP